MRNLQTIMLLEMVAQYEKSSGFLGMMFVVLKVYYVCAALPDPLNMCLV